MSKKRLRSQGRNIVFNVYQKILGEQGAEQTQSSILSHVQSLAGVSNTTIRRIVAEGRSTNSSGGNQFQWTKRIIKAGPRWIIIHAGGENGYVPNCCLVYRSKSTSADYHHDMNKDKFTKWVMEKLIPNLTKPSLIVMDNAKYHSVQLNKPPTQADRIAVIKEWLQSNNIPYDYNWRKRKLLEAVKNHKPESKYQINEILKSHGHEVFRLPPYHCTLNPIELIWRIM
ncbi:hypothetical protein EVAR_31123_1 [Eumeta japonica]|uniref:Tc1-like transposase DDE domain-containing protein n=1 Tax=Eumeta variegata TaxID=151549 RepID=A0A4C1VFU3_EUMVA|nr:hypothetical protein EVAR_31123_1 [Eumeta japonica]